MENINYSNSRKTQENKDFLMELNKSLDDWNVSNPESKILVAKYNKIREQVDWEKNKNKKQILAITKNELSWLAQWLNIDKNSSINVTLNKLISMAKINEPIIDDKSEIVDDKSEIVDDKPEIVDDKSEIVDDKSEIVDDKPEESKEKSESLIWEYFAIPKEEWEALKSKLENNWLELDIINFLVTYKNYIDNNIYWIWLQITDKIRKSIWLRVLKLSQIIDERIAFVDMQISEWDYKSEDRVKEIKNERWIINSRLKDSFSFVDNELLPSIQLLKLKQEWIINSEKIAGYSEEYDINFWIEEINEMINSDLDEDWNFDEWFFSTQDILNIKNEKDANFISDNKLDIKWVETASLLTEEDEVIEKNATKWFMLAIAWQIAVEVWPAAVWSIIPLAWTAAWAIAWAAVWWVVDWVDMISDTEVLLDLVQSAWLVDPNYRMEKTWVDNILAGIWLIPWMTVAIKWKKISKFLSKLPTEEVSSWMKNIQDIFIAKFSWKKLPKFNNPLKNISLPDIKTPNLWNIRNNLWVIINKLPDTTQIKETITKPFKWLEDKFKKGFKSEDLWDIEKTKNHISDEIWNLPDNLKWEVENAINWINEYLEILKQNKFIEYKSKQWKIYNWIIEEFEVLPNWKIKASISIEGKNSKPGQYPLNMNKWQVIRWNEKYTIQVDWKNKWALVFDNIDDFKKYVSPKNIEKLLQKLPQWTEVKFIDDSWIERVWKIVWFNVNNWWTIKIWVKVDGTHIKHQYEVYWDNLFNVKKIDTNYEKIMWNFPQWTEVKFIDDSWIERVWKIVWFNVNNWWTIKIWVKVDGTHIKHQYEVYWDNLFNVKKIDIIYESKLLHKIPISDIKTESDFLDSIWITKNDLKYFSDIWWDEMVVIQQINWYNHNWYNYLCEISKKDGIDLSKLSREEFVNFAIKNNVILKHEEVSMAPKFRNFTDNEKKIFKNNLSQKVSDWLVKLVNYLSSRLVTNDWKKASFMNEWWILQHTNKKWGKINASWFHFSINKWTKLQETWYLTQKWYINFNNINNLTLTNFSKFLVELKKWWYNWLPINPLDPIISILCFVFCTLFIY